MLQHALSLWEASSKPPSQSQGFEISSSGENLEIHCIGMPVYTVAVAAELITWLSSILREAQDDGSPNPSTILSFSQFSFTPQKSDDGFIFHIQAVLTESLLYSRDNCWTHLFHYCTVTTTQFPVPWRPIPSGGLEVSLEIMTALAGAKYLVNFCDKTYIKGFSTMLVVTEMTDSTVLWHFLYSESRETRISYTDGQIDASKSPGKSLALSYPELVKRRHILGWSPQAEWIAGTLSGSDGDYNVKLSTPYANDPDCERLSPGYPLFLDSSILISSKGRPWYPEITYSELLRHISCYKFLLYDTETSKAWLAEGSLALLYLLRCHIEHSRKGDSATIFLPEQSDLIFKGDKNKKTEAQMAFNILYQCRRVQLYMDDKSLMLSSKVEDISQLIFLIKEFFSRRKNPGGMVQVRGMTHMMGFDFRHVAAIQTVKSRLEKMDPASAGWSCLPQHFECVPLFGAGFGNLIQHTGGSCSECSPMLQQPDTKGLLCVLVQDILRYIKSEGGDDMSWHVFNDMTWDVDFNKSSVHGTSCLNSGRAYVYKSVESTESGYNQTSTLQRHRPSHSKQFIEYIQTHVNGAIVLGMSKEEIQARHGSSEETASGTESNKTASEPKQYPRSPPPIWQSAPPTNESSFLPLGWEPLCVSSDSSVVESPPASSDQQAGQSPRHISVEYKLASH